MGPQSVPQPVHSVGAPPAPLALPAPAARRCALGLGANLGDARATLAAAVRALRAQPGVSAVQVSALYRTAPVGGPAQPDFLNAVVVLDTAMSAIDLLGLAHDLEQRHGRQRAVRWGPRTLDVDILAVDGLSSDWPPLMLPHPRSATRAFVLVPWAQVDVEARVPGALTVAQALARLDPQDVSTVRLQATGHWWS